MIQKYFSPKQVEEKYGIKTSKIYWWIHQNRITYIKVGKSILIPEIEFKKFLDANTNRSLREEDCDFQYT